MVIAEVEAADAASSGSELGWQTLQRLKSLGPAPAPGPGRLRRRLGRRIKRAPSDTSQRPFLLHKASLSVEDGLADLGNGKAPMAAQDRFQAFQLEKPPTGMPLGPHMQLLYSAMSSVQPRRA